MRSYFATLFSAQVINNATAVSETQDVRSRYGYAVYLSYTGALLVGTAKLQMSMDDSTWVDLPNSGETAQHTVAASGGANFWHVTSCYYPYVRLSFAQTDAHAATVTAKFVAKGAQ